MKKPEVIILSGKVVTHGLLADENPEFSSTESPPGVGDIKIIAVPKPVSPRQHQDRIRVASGFFSASIFDGHQWRRFKLRADAQGSATYTDRSTRSFKLASVIKRLKQLATHEAKCVQGGYEVDEPKLIPPFPVPIAPASYPQQVEMVQLPLL